MGLERQLVANYGLVRPRCRPLRSLTNDVFEVSAAGERYALKLYNAASRHEADVVWELALTCHLIDRGVPVAEPVAGRNGLVGAFEFEGRERVGVLFRWAPGRKPTTDLVTYDLLGRAAARIHLAADTFAPAAARDVYDARTLIDDQLRLMRQPLLAAGQWRRLLDLTGRLQSVLADPLLDAGVCHMDLTLDNVHYDAHALTVFDFDSAGWSWRSIEAWGVLRYSAAAFDAWTNGYRSARPFSDRDVAAVATFAIVGDLRNVVWKLGLARSSRGASLGVADLPAVVDGWLSWERTMIDA